MRSNHAQIVLAGFVAITAAACAGFKGGWKSVAYVGEAPSETVVNEAEKGLINGRSKLALPGAQLEVEIDNRLRTYDMHVYLFVLPLWWNPRDVYAENHEEGWTRVYLTITPSDSSFVFRPTEAVLRMESGRFPGARGFEFGIWNEAGQRITEGQGWAHRPLASDVALDVPGRRYHLSIDFETPVPSPKSQQIELDLSRALVSPEHPETPVIRFAPVRWKLGYT
ncbi:MAG: hypothetical protein IPK72_00375 [Candidatus Eisenbacteria bacterium]|nr:hypothetical protein [Candidatus Eisenbacteria bacterium]